MPILRRRFNQVPLLQAKSVEREPEWPELCRLLPLMCGKRAFWPSRIKPLNCNFLPCCLTGCLGLVLLSAARREKNRKMKDQRTAQGKEALEEHETELRLQAEAHTKQMDDMAA